MNRYAADELRDHQAEAWALITEACLELGLDPSEPGTTACEQTINWIRRQCARLSLAVKIRDELAERFPRRTISVSETAFHDTGHGVVAASDYTEYVISVQPGFDMLDSQNFGGNSLQECLNKFNTSAAGR